MLKILVVSPWYPTDENPSSGVFIKEQTTALIRKGVNPSVLFYKANLRFNLIKLFLNKTNKDSEIKTHKFPVFYKNGLHYPLKIAITRRLWINQYLNLFKKYISQFGNPDIIHANTYWGGLIALEIKKKYNIPYIVTEHSSSLIKYHTINKTNKKIITKAYENSSSLIAVSKALREGMKDYTDGEIKIIPNSINTSFFTPKKIEKFNKHITVSIIGGLIPIKQIHLAISSINLLAEKGYNISLNIIGKGKLHNELNDFIKKLNAEEYIKLLGQKCRNEIKEILNETDIYLHTSKFETFGVALIEAMSMGLPVVSTKSGGPESFITDNVGILVDKDCPQNIANAIEEIIENKNRYDSNKIRMYVVNNFSDEVISEKIITLYNRILEK